MLKDNITLKEQMEICGQFFETYAGKYIQEELLHRFLSDHSHVISGSPMDMDIYYLEFAMNMDLSSKERTFLCLLLKENMENYKEHHTDWEEAYYKLVDAVDNQGEHISLEEVFVALIPAPKNVVHSSLLENYDEYAERHNLHPRDILIDFESNAVFYKELARKEAMNKQ